MKSFEDITATVKMTKFAHADVPVSMNTRKAVVLAWNAINEKASKSEEDAAALACLAALLIQRGCPEPEVDYLTEYCDIVMFG